MSPIDPDGKALPEPEQGGADGEVRPLAGPCAQATPEAQAVAGAESTASIEAAPVPGAGSASTPRFAWLRGLARNLATALALAFLRRRQTGALRADGAALIGLFAVNLAAQLAYDIYAVYPAKGRLDLEALPSACFWSLPLLLSAWLIARLNRDDAQADRSLPLAVAGFALAALGSIASTALAIAADFSPAIDQRYVWLVWAPIVWVTIAWAIGAPRMAGLRRWRALAAGVMAAALIMGPQWSADAGARLWVAADAEDAGSAGGPQSAGAEQYVYGQIDMLEDALDRITPGRPGVTELYSIVFAGSGSEDVFANEAQGVNEIMTDLFDTGDRSLVLANSSKQPGQAPFATVTALQRALATVAERMDESEDVLFLFLTAHGSADSTLDVSLPPYRLESLTPARLRALLDESGIRFRVIVVSACYSGGFVQALANPDTLVITASRADRPSFGCRDGSQWTDFGRAYFKEALPATGSFEGALRRARELISKREAEQNLTPSDPQIFVGQGIRERLQELQTQKLGPRLLVRRRTVSRAAGA